MRPAHGNAVAEVVLQKTLEGKLPLKQIQRGFILLSVRGPHWGNRISPGHPLWAATSLLPSAPNVYSR